MTIKHEPQIMSSRADTEHEVMVYPMTGRQLFFTVPHSVCEECDLTVRLVQRVAAESPGVRVRVLPWFRHGLKALLRGGWHPPIVTIDGRVFSQGIVPDEARLRSALGGALRPAEAE